MVIGKKYVGNNHGLLEKSSALNSQLWVKICALNRRLLVKIIYHIKTCPVLIKIIAVIKINRYKTTITTA